MFLLGILDCVSRETIANRGSDGKLVYRHFRGAASWLRRSKHAIASVATGRLRTGMTEHEHVGHKVSKHVHVLKGLFDWN